MGDVDPDRELVARAQKELPQRAAAYNQLVRRHTSNIYRRSYRILRSEPDAEEATQDVLMAMFRNLPSFRFERPLSSWLSVVTPLAFGMGLAFALGARNVVGAVLAGHYVRQSLAEGTTVEVAGQRGVVEEVGPVTTVIRDGEHAWRFPNTRLIEEVVKE
jgi:hypothetical protein